MSNQNPTSPDPSDAVPGYTPPSYEPPTTPATPGYTPPAGGYSEPPAPPAGDPYAAPGAYPPPPAPGIPGGYSSAPATPHGTLVEWPIRALGGLIDYVAPSIIIGVIGSILSNITNSGLGGVLQSVLGIAWWVYLAYLSGTYGITPGRAIAKTKLISESTGELLGFPTALLRQLGHVVDSIICYIGWLFPLWDAKKQTLADKMVKSVVVDNSADPNASQIHWS